MKRATFITNEAYILKAKKEYLEEQFSVNLTIKKLIMLSMSLLNQFSKSVSKIGELYSSIMGINFSNSETLRILQVQISFAALLLPMNASLKYYAGILAWICLSLYLCKDIKCTSENNNNTKL